MKETNDRKFLSFPHTEALLINSDFFETMVLFLAKPISFKFASKISWEAIANALLMVKGTF